jgi:hypothetical protein
VSCQHGNWPPCEQCDELDAQYDRGFNAGIATAGKLRLLLRECDAALGMLSDMPPVIALREAIKQAIPIERKGDPDE